MKFTLLSILIVSHNIAASAQHTGNISLLSERHEVSEADSLPGGNAFFADLTTRYAMLSSISPPYCDLGSPKKWYWISADIVPHFVIGGRSLRFPVHITPRYRVRWMHDDPKKGDTSLSVRTPSFMPSLAVFFPMSKPAGERIKFIGFTSITFGHHSNGQDGDEFRNKDTLNTHNGNFSTNHVEAAYHFRIRKSFATSAVNGAFHNELFGRIAFEQHYLTAPALRSTYGESRINLSLGSMKVKHCVEWNKQERSVSERENYRWVFNTTFILGSRQLNLSEPERRINFDLSYYKRILPPQAMYIFLTAGYYGSDTYNIYYQNQYWYFRTGLALGFFATTVKSR